MARNDTEKEAAVIDNKPRKPLTQIQQERITNKKKALEKALLADKVRFKSSCDSQRFQEFLQSRLTFWETKKDKTFHAKNMYEKTKTILTNFTI